MARELTVERHVEVTVELSEFSTDDLIEELRSRGDRRAREFLGSEGSVISEVYEARKKRDAAKAKEGQADAR